jgi:hypothetical protein
MWQKSNTGCQPVRCVTVINQGTGEPYLIPIWEDHQTLVNWIAPHIARKCGFEILDVPGGKYIADFHGIPYEVAKRVSFTWSGQGEKTEQTECLIAPPQLPIDGVLVGKHFTENVGRSRDLFLEQPASTKGMIMMHKKATVGKTF